MGNTSFPTRRLSVVKVGHHNNLLELHVKLPSCVELMPLIVFGAIVITTFVAIIIFQSFDHPANYTEMYTISQPFVLYSVRFFVAYRFMANSNYSASLSTCI